jgi:hypothetical protein
MTSEIEPTTVHFCLNRQIDSSFTLPPLAHHSLSRIKFQTIRRTRLSPRFVIFHRCREKAQKVDAYQG